MKDRDPKPPDQEFHELTGALAAIDALRESLELRRDEARDECAHEMMDDVVALVQAHEIEYQRRKEALQASPGPRGNS